MSKYTKEDILRLAKEQNVRFVRLQFTDILGCMKNVAITINQLEKALDQTVSSYEFKVEYVCEGCRKA